MAISEELKEAIGKVREGLAEARAGSGDIIDSVKKGATEASGKALDKTQKALAILKEALEEVGAKSAKEAEATKVTIKEHLDNAGKAVAEAGEELARASAQVTAKSIEGTEKAVAKVREALVKVEELIAKMK